MINEESIGIAFGHYINSKRIDKGFTLRKFCKAINEDPSNWSKIERGLLNPPQSTQKLKKIASILALNKNESKELEYMAAITCGKIPKEIYCNKELLARLPFIFNPKNREGLMKVIKIINVQ